MSDSSSRVRGENALSADGGQEDGAGTASRENWVRSTMSAYAAMAGNVRVERAIRRLGLEIVSRQRPWRRLARRWLGVPGLVVGRWAGVVLGRMGRA
jgi:hypothetical protein